MKNPLIFFIFITSLLVSSCCKSDEVTPNALHPLEKFIGKWVPVELIVDGQSNFGPFAFNGFFGAYDDSFEVKDTSSNYYPSVYYIDSLGNYHFENSKNKIGIIKIDINSSSISFFEEDNYRINGSILKIDNDEMWLSHNNINRILKLKKI